MTIVLAATRPTFAIIASDTRRTVGVGAAGIMKRVEAFDDNTRKLAVHPTQPLAIGFAGTAIGVLPLGEELDHILRTVEQPSVDRLAEAFSLAVSYDSAVAVAEIDDGVARLSRVLVRTGQTPYGESVQHLVFPPSAELRAFYDSFWWDEGETPDEVAASLRSAITAGIREEARLVADEMQRVCGGAASVVMVDRTGARFVST